MTETKKEKDTRDYFIIKYSMSSSQDNLVTTHMDFVLAEDSLDAIKQFKEDRREDWLERVTIEPPEPLDMSKVLTKIKLNKMYDRHWYHISGVLGSYWKKLPRRKKGAVGRYYIIKELPTQEEFRSLFISYYTGSAQSLYEEAKDDLEALKDEVEEWKDNIEEYFSDSDKYSMLEDALNCFEQYDLPDWPDDQLPDFDVTYIHPVPKMYRGRPSISRDTRLSEACDKLQTVMDGLEEQKTELVDQARAHAEKIEEYNERIDEAKQEMQEKRDEAAEIRDDWKVYQEELAEYKVGREENPEEYDEEPAEPDHGPDRAAELEDEASKLEDKKDDLETVRDDYCTHNSIEQEIDPDEIESTIESFVEEIEQYKDEVEGVEFPGMFG